MNWIMIEDSRPEEGQRVIYYFEKTGISVGYYGKEGIFYGVYGWLSDDVTHWMPMPEPPRDAD